MTRPPPTPSTSSAGYRPLHHLADASSLEEQTTHEVVYEQRSPRVSYRWFIILWIIVMLSASLHENIRIRLGGNKPYFNFFLFSQESSAGYCAGHGHCVPEHIRPFWTIHGLWPSNDTSWPQLCNRTEKFNVTLLEPILPSLNIYWPSATAGNSHFWAHEWQKHGSCALKVPPLSGVFDYFNTTLSLSQKFNVTTFLNDANIVPSTNQTYTVAELLKALNVALKSKANIVCKKVDGFPNPVLTEVRFCLSKADLIPIDCKMKHEQCGDGAVYYLPMNHTNPLEGLDPWARLLVDVFTFYVKHISPV